MSPSVRTNSQFEPFSITLSNGATLTGISHIPPRRDCTPGPRPLVIGIHGGKCTCHNFDVDENHTSSLYSAALGVPFVAFNRPGYGYSTSFLPLAKDTNYILETGKWLHELILPALWEKFGKPNDCAAVVTNSHSMAVPQTVVAAAMYCRDETPRYPLSGLILSGFGTGWIARAEIQPKSDQDLKPVVFYEPGVKQLLMLNDERLQLCEPSVYKLAEAQDVGMPIEEVIGMLGWWPEHWQKFAKEIEIPILYGLGEFDWLWEATRDRVKEFESNFTGCPSFEGSLVVGAPHAIEWSRVGGGWSIKCLGWACIVTAAAVARQDSGLLMK